MKKLILSFFTLLTLAVGLVSVSEAQTNQSPQNYGDKYPDMLDMSKIELEYKLEETKLYRVLRTSKTVIDGEPRCGKYIRLARESDEKLKELNRRYETSWLADYQLTANHLKQDNITAIRDYKSCFTQNLSNFSVIAAQGVASYEAHRSKFSDLDRTYAKIADLNDYIAALQQALEDEDIHDFEIKAFVDSATAGDGRGVQIRRGGATWQTAIRGSQLKKGTRLKTGPRGRARIKLVPADPRENSGPTIVNIGSNTEIVVDELFSRRNSELRSTGVLRLIRGTIRAFSKNWGSQTSFSIRTGTSICGIRGTEVAVSYDPVTRVAKYTLDRGDAYAEAGGRRVTLQPRTSVRVANNAISRPQGVSQEEWDELVGTTESIGASTSRIQPIGPGSTLSTPPLTQNRPQHWPSPEELNRAFGGMSALMTRQVAQSYFEAFIESRFANVIQHSTGSLREFHKQKLGAAPIPELNGTSFIGVETKCSACGTGDDCDALVEIEELVGRSHRKTQVLATVTRLGPGDNKVSAVVLATPQLLSEFQAKRPYCD